MAKPSMKYITSVKGLDFWCFRPSMFCQYFMDYPEEEHPWYEKRLLHRVRMMLEHLRGGYIVYYLYASEELVGHIVVARGGWRLRVSTEKDIVLGPIWISPRHRNRGFAARGIHAVLHELGLEYENAYEYIAKDNWASRRTVEKNNYVLLGEARERGLLKHIEMYEGGEFVVYRYSHS